MKCLFIHNDMDFLVTYIYFRLFCLCSFGSYVILGILGLEMLRPRGVSLPRAPFYSPVYDFTCLDNSKTIPFSQVNDDYCDCPDSSDEPGTSACPYGTFYCTNAGYESLIIKSLRVNDGICDCCDGSDEYTSLSICSNNCQELEKYAKEEALEREIILKAGKELRAEFSRKGFQEKQNKKLKLLELEKNKNEAERSMIEKERIKFNAVELENNALEYYTKLEKKHNEDENKTHSEALSAFNRYDSNRDGKVSCSELQQYLIFDKDNDGEVSAEESKYFLNGHEYLDVEKFVSEAWSVITRYLMVEVNTSDGNAVADIYETITDERIPDNDQEFSVNGGEYVDVPKQDAEQKDEEILPLLYDEETQRLIDFATAARKEFLEASSVVKAIESEIQNIKEFLNNDFGSDEEYVQLRGQCFEYVDHEYIYKLLPFDKIIQQPKSGSLETRLGSWGKWTGPEYDKYRAMLFEGGQACWNGPQRSTLVKLSCGSENRITSVSEPNKCEYVFVFETPAACYDSINDEDEKRHDEL